MERATLPDLAMSRCLSERALLRLIAGSGREAQRAHLAACRRRGVRYRVILRDLDRVTDVLFHTAPPRWSRSPLTRHWLPASASAVAGDDVRGRHRAPGDAGQGIRLRPTRTLHP